VTARRRASETRKNPFEAGMAVPAATVAAPTPPEQMTEAAAAEQPAGRAKATKPPTIKFTANLDYETSGYFDELASLARRKLYRQVDKVDVLKALIRLASDDGSLRDQVIDEIGKH
jgi:hypothetical protein